MKTENSVSSSFPNNRQIITLGAFLSAIGVILGAFGAHALRGKIGYDLFDIYQTANQYLLIHSAALILYGIWHKVAVRDSLKAWPAICFFLGSVIFCGSLYTITFTGLRMFGAVTPVGGVLFIAGWLGFAFQAKSR